MVTSIDDVMNRIRKLLALSTSSNEHEAASAAAQAARLMREYDIEQARLEVAGEQHAADEPIENHRIEWERSGKRPVWRDFIVNGVTRSCGCHSYRSGSVPVLLGRLSATRTASYMYTFLVREIARLAEEGWQRAKADGSCENGRTWKHSFSYGAALAVVERLREERQIDKAALKAQATASDERALAVMQRRDLAVDKAYEAMNLRGGNSPAAPRSAGAFDRGRAAGRSIKLRGSAALGAAPKKLR